MKFLKMTMICFLIGVFAVYWIIIIAGPFLAVPVYLKLKEVRESYTSLHERVSALEEKTK